MVSATTPPPPVILPPPIPKICLKLVHYPLLHKLAKWKRLCPHFIHPYPPPHYPIQGPQQFITRPYPFKIIQSSATRRPEPIEKFQINSFVAVTAEAEIEAQSISSKVDLNFAIKK